MSKSQNVPVSITIKILLKFYQGHSVVPRVGGRLDQLISRSVNRYRVDTQSHRWWLGQFIETFLAELLNILEKHSLSLGSSNCIQDTYIHSFNIHSFIHLTLVERQPCVSAIVPPHSLQLHLLQKSGSGIGTGGKIYRIKLTIGKKSIKKVYYNPIFSQFLL